MKVSNKRLKEIIESLTTSHVFSVTFIKRTDGTVRQMLCRKGVKKALAGGPAAYDPKDHNLIFVYDMLKGQYRSISFDHLISATIEGVTYIVRRHNDSEIMP